MMQRGENYLGSSLTLSIILHLAILSLQFGVPGAGLPAMGGQWGALQSSAPPPSLHVELRAAAQAVTVTPASVLPKETQVAPPVPVKSAASGLIQSSLRPKQVDQPPPVLRKARKKPSRPARSPIKKPQKINEVTPVISVEPDTQEERWRMAAAQAEAEPALDEPVSEALTEDAEQAVAAEAAARLEAQRDAEQLAAQRVAEEEQRRAAERQAQLLEAAREREAQAQRQLVEQAEAERRAALARQQRQAEEALARAQAEEARREVEQQALAKKAAEEAAVAEAEALRRRAEAESRERQRLAELAAEAQRQAERERERIVRLAEEKRRQEQIEKLEREKQEREKAAALAHAQAEAEAQARVAARARAEAQARMQAAEEARQRALAEQALAAERARLAAAASGVAADAGKASGKEAGQATGSTAGGARKALDLASQAMNLARQGLNDGLPLRAADGATSEAQPATETASRGSLLGRSPIDLQISFYGDGWEEKIRRIGNINYPRLSRHLAYGPVVVAVRIRSDGSLESVAVVKTSGNQELDEAARRIIEMCAPFAAFPPDLRRTHEVIEIRRSLSFTERPPLFIGR